MSKLWPAPSGWYVILSRSVFQRRYIIMSPQKSCLFVVNTFIMRIKASYKHVIEHWWKKASFVSDQDDKSSTWSQLSLPVLLFWPNCWLGHPENLSVMLSKIIFSGSKYSKNILFNFEKGSTACDCVICRHYSLTSLLSLCPPCFISIQWEDAKQQSEQRWLPSGHKINFHSHIIC